MPDYTKKPGVTGVISREIDFALGYAKRFFDNLGVDLVLTSLADSQHKQGSKHPSGQAVDIRTKDLKSAEKRDLKSYLQSSLSHQGYDVFLEKVGTKDEHLHIEYDPKIATGNRQPQQTQPRQQSQSAPLEKEPVVLQPYQLPMQSKKVIILGVAIVLFLVAFARLK